MNPSRLKTTARTSKLKMTVSVMSWVRWLGIDSSHETGGPLYYTPLELLRT